MSDKSKTKTAKGAWVQSDIKLDGKTVVITGSNTGIGLETAIDMAQRGARVIMACRNMEKANKAKERVEEESGSKIVFTKELDLSSLDSIRSFASDVNETEERLDILINNAGVMMCPQSKTKDGFEMQMGTNHLGHFLLTNLLLDLIKKSAPSRIINLSSLAHAKFFISKLQWDDLAMEKNYSPSKAYSQSKLMNVMFTKELAERLEGTGVTTYSIHPGGVKTDLQRHVYENYNFFVRGLMRAYTSWIAKSAKGGAQTSIFCAIAPEILDYSGSYFQDCHRSDGSINPAALVPEDNKRLWEISEELVGLK